MWRQLQVLNLYLLDWHSASVFYLGLHACVFLSWHFRKIGTFCHFPICRCTGWEGLFIWELVLSSKRRIFSIIEGQIEVIWTCAWSLHSQRQRTGSNLSCYLRERGKKKKILLAFTASVNGRSVDWQNQLKGKSVDCQSLRRALMDSN